jgi:hypothetical protein
MTRIVSKARKIAIVLEEMGTGVSDVKFREGGVEWQIFLIRALITRHASKRLES